MKKSTVERMYSAKVAQLLNDGWHINTGTMPGHQGEIAHVDLTDGSEIRRAVLYREMVWGRDSFDGHKPLHSGRQEHRPGVPGLGLRHLEQPP
jgi:hypothetical protein